MNVFRIILAEKHRPSAKWTAVSWDSKSTKVQVCQCWGAHVMTNQNMKTVSTNYSFLDTCLLAHLQIRHQLVWVPMLLMPQLAVERCHHHHGTSQKEGSDRVWRLQGHLAGSARRQDTAEGHRSPPRRVLWARGDPAGGTEWFPTEPLYHRYDVCDSSVTGAGAEGMNSALCML